MKRLVLFAAALLCQGFAMAGENCYKSDEGCGSAPDRCSKEVKTCGICRDIPLCYPIIVYDSFDNSGLGIGARADLLYMNYTNPIVTYVTQDVIADRQDIANIYGPHANPQLGCDIALNYTMPCNPGYTFEAGWFHIIPKWSRTITSDHLLPSHVVLATTAAPGVGTISSNIAINFIDLLLAKKIAFDNSFTMAPYAGILGGFMKGTSTAVFTATSGNFGSGMTYLDLIQKISFKGIGTKIGTSYEFKLWYGVSILGNWSFNSLYGFTKSHMTSTDNGTGLIYGASSYFNHHARTFFDSLLGLVWKTHFLKNCLYADLHVQWRYQSFPSGWWQVEAELNDSMHELSMEGQGLEVGITFKF